jgi:hypothetical protein
MQGLCDSWLVDSNVYDSARVFIGSGGYCCRERAQSSKAARPSFSPHCVGQTVPRTAHIAAVRSSACFSQPHAAPRPAARDAARRPRRALRAALQRGAERPAPARAARRQSTGRCGGETQAGLGRCGRHGAAQQALHSPAPSPQLGPQGVRAGRRRRPALAPGQRGDRLQAAVRADEGRRQAGAAEHRRAQRRALARHRPPAAEHARGAARRAAPPGCSPATRTARTAPACSWWRGHGTYGTRTRRSGISARSWRTRPWRTRTTTCSRSTRTQRAACAGWPRSRWRRRRTRWRCAPSPARACRRRRRSGACATASTARCGCARPARPWGRAALPGPRSRPSAGPTRGARAQDFQRRHGARAVADALDVGCSAGVSSRFLAADFPDAQVTGVDLSPHFLAVAEWRERCAARPKPPVSDRQGRRVVAAAVRRVRRGAAGALHGSLRRCGGAAAGASRGRTGGGCATGTRRWRRPACPTAAPTWSRPRS